MRLHGTNSTVTTGDTGGCGPPMAGLVMGAVAGQGRF